jgi:hypothetical protein
MSSVNSHTSDAYNKLKENTITVMKSYYAASNRLIFHIPIIPIDCYNLRIRIDVSATTVNAENNSDPCS